MTTAVKIRVTKYYECPNLGEKIKKARKKSPMTVTDLASQAGMSVANWYRIEAEENKILPKETLDAIVAALGEDLELELDEKSLC